MKVHILQENFIKILSRVGRIVSTKTQLPIMQNVLLVGEEGRLTATTTNLETTESTWAGGKIETEGKACVSVKLLTEFVATLPADTVVLETKNDGVRVACAGFEATIPGFSAGDFPQASASGKTKTLDLPKATFFPALERVLFAASTDEGRPLLNGVKIKTTNEGVLIAATDGYRLSIQTIVIQSKKDLDLVIPSRALLELVKIAHEEKETESLAISQANDNQLVFALGNTEITTRLIDGEYPNFAKIIPKAHTTQVIFEKEALLRAARAASIFARDNANIVRFHIKEGQVEISAATASAGEGKMTIDATVEGEGGDIAFNCRYLLEFLSNYQEDELVLEMSGALNPGVFKSKKDPSSLHIIMPVRV